MLFITDFSQSTTNHLMIQSVNFPEVVFLFQLLLNILYFTTWISQLREAEWNVELYNWFCCQWRYEILCKELLRTAKIKLFLCHFLLSTHSTYHRCVRIWRRNTKSEVKQNLEENNHPIYKLRHNAFLMAKFLRLL